MKKKMDNEIYIRELERYSPKDLYKFLKSESSLKELLDLDIVKFDGESYFFDYVGLLIVGETIIKCYPKYIKDNKFPKSNFKQVIKVIKKFKSEYGEFEYQNEEFGDIPFNLISEMLFLIEDYYEHGIYTNVRNIIEINGNGEIDWNRTVNENLAIIQDNKPFYTELQTRHKMNDLYDYFRVLHEIIITECSKYLETRGLLELFDLTPIELTDMSLDDLEETYIIRNKIQNELNIEFNTRKQKLLQLMDAYISHENSFNNVNFLTLYGTPDYNIVWEKMCSQIFSNKLDYKLSELGYKGYGNSTLRDLIKNPIWYIKDKKPIPKDKQRPDLITLYENSFIILDAKYYDLKFGKNKLDGQPGLKDITKQYLYQLAFNQFIVDEGFLNIENAFLFPTNGLKVENWGHVELEILSKLPLEDNYPHLKNIQIIMLPASEVNKRYLNNEENCVGWLEFKEEKNK